MNIISSETEIEITTIEQVEPFVSITPPGWGSESWLIERIVTKQQTGTPNDEFAHTIFHGEPNVRAYARRLTQRGTPTGALRLVWWLHDREAIEREWLASPQARAQGVC
jgi:hypothetical protein